MAGSIFYGKNTSIHFIVKNISSTGKRLIIFNYPFDLNQQRDLLAAPGISESDIRESLVKGELANKIRVGDLEIVSTNIDLLQFDEQQRNFLINAGATLGVNPNKIAKDTGAAYLELEPSSDTIPPNSIFFDNSGTPSYTDENGDSHSLISGSGGGFTAGGDLSGNSVNQTVIRINGATIPVSGSLTTGNVLKVSGTSSLYYGAINLAGGTNHIIGVLPEGNLPDSTTGSKGIIQLAGDISGTASSITVNRIQNRDISSIAPSDGYTLTWSTPDSYWRPSPTAITWSNITNWYVNENGSIYNSGTSSNSRIPWSELQKRLRISNTRYTSAISVDTSGSSISDASIEIELGPGGSFTVSGTGASFSLPPITGGPIEGLWRRDKTGTITQLIGGAGSTSHTGGYLITSTGEFTVGDASPTNLFTIPIAIPSSCTIYIQGRLAVKAVSSIAAAVLKFDDNISRHNGGSSQRIASASDSNDLGSVRDSALVAVDYLVTFVSDNLQVTYTGDPSIATKVQYVITLQVCV